MRTILFLCELMKGSIWKESFWFQIFVVSLFIFSTQFWISYCQTEDEYFWNCLILSVYLIILRWMSCELFFTYSYEWNHQHEKHIRFFVLFKSVDLVSFKRWTFIGMRFFLCLYSGFHYSSGVLYIRGHKMFDVIYEI
jgi:hypothetical protein